MQGGLVDRIAQILFSPVRRQADEVARLRAENEARMARVEKLEEANRQSVYRGEQSIAEAKKSAATLYTLLAKLDVGRSSSISSDCKPASE
ncbi:MAG: hypothetical protein K0Q57_687 [Gammaproteobacteria bacterium]|jgi:hypothetical protein|nr:hypothetical protein [Gammaproteobacteria bacterium]